MTHDEVLLKALRSGPKMNHELYALGIMVHSRAASLRKKGHAIECRREGRNTYVYWLERPTPSGGVGHSSGGPLEAGACADPSRGAGAPASSGSNLGPSSGSPDTPRPEDGPLTFEGAQMAFATYLDERWPL